MSLQDEVILRYKRQFLVDLTRPDETDQDTIDTTKLDLAADDVEGDFHRVIGRDFEILDKQDLAVACEGVVAYLVMWAAQGGETNVSLRDAYLDRLRALRRRILASTNSKLEPTDDTFRNSVSRPLPLFDDSYFVDYVPEFPRGKTYGPWGN